jgi:hypothetical protein
MISIASNYAATHDARESLKHPPSKILDGRTITATNKRARLKSSILRTWWQQPSPRKAKVDSATEDAVPAAANHGAL